MPPNASLAHYAILTAMLAPAFFLTATAALLTSANARLARIIDRARALLRDLTGCDDPETRALLERRIVVQRRLLLRGTRDQRAEAADAPACRQLRRTLGPWALACGVGRRQRLALTVGQIGELHRRPAVERTRRDQRTPTGVGADRAGLVLGPVIGIHAGTGHHPVEQAASALGVADTAEAQRGVAADDEVAAVDRARQRDVDQAQILSLTLAAQAGWAARP